MNLHKQPALGIVLGIPFSGRPVAAPWAVALACVQWPIGMGQALKTVIGKRRDVARNEICRFALDHNARYVAMIDDDTEPPIDFLVRMTAVLGQDEPNGARMIGGIYCAKTEHPQPLVYRGESQGSFWDWKAGTVFEVDGIGAGCIVISTDVLRQLPEPWFKDIDENYTPGTGPTIKSTITDDLYFCQKLRAAGFTILADGAVLCKHWDAQAGRSYQLNADSYPLRGRDPRTMIDRTDRLQRFVEQVAADGCNIGSELRREAALLAAPPEPAGNMPGTFGGVEQELPVGVQPGNGGVNISNALSIDGWMEPAELEWLAQRAKDHLLIVELGSFLGRSTRALADNTDGQVFAVDDWQGLRDRDGAYKRFTTATTNRDFRRNLQDHLATGKVQMLHMDHGQFAAEAEKLAAAADMVFVDGCHDYEAVARDIQTWLRIPGRRLLCGHDANWVGVDQALCELLPHAQHVPGTSLWWVEINVPSGVAAGGREHDHDLALA